MRRNIKGLFDMVYCIVVLTAGCGTESETDYWQAVNTGDSKEVDRFIRKGIDVNLSDSHGTALHRAAQRGDITIVRLLIERGAGVNAAIKENALSVFEKGYLETFEIVGAKLNTAVEAAFGAMPLHLAIVNK
jgi:ankyrin repeat protein